MDGHLKPKKSSKRRLGRLKMVLMIDEAKYLVSTNFFNAFRWVIDQVIEPAWLLANPKEDWPLPFMVFFLGTNSTVADFLPPGDHSSARYFFEFMKVPQPFTALDWDIPVPHDSLLHYSPSNYEALAGMSWLCRFGRPYWQAQWGSTLPESTSKCKDAMNIVTAAENKLHQQCSRIGFEKLFQVSERDDKWQEKEWKEKYILTCSAILGVLAVINLDFTSPKRAAELVASRLRWAFGCDSKRTYLLTAYPSEPVLAEAAFRLLFANSRGDKGSQTILKRILEAIAGEVERGDYDVGGDGELVARILCLLARRRALSLKYPDVKMDVMELSSGGDPLLYSNRPTPVSVFLECLFKDLWVQAMKQASPNVWQLLENSYVNFSHFTEEISHKYAFNSLTPTGLLALYLRGCAIQCRQGQEGIDIVIPMVVLPSSENILSPIKISHISAIIFQIKNRKKDSGVFTEDFVNEAKFDIRHIEGLSAVEDRPYVGIWMSFGVDCVDFAIEGCQQPFKPDWKSSCGASKEIQRPRRKASTHSQIDMDSSNALRPPKKQKQNDMPKSRLVIRARGFKEMYNDEMPLDILDRFIDRHRYSSSIGGLHFYSDLIRHTAMRGAWNLSFSDTISTFLDPFGRLNLED